jgi:hypothetical protein
MTKNHALLSTLVAVTFACCAPPVHADGLIYQLPPDGTMALYSIEAISNRDGMEVKTTGSLTMSSVGKVAVNGDGCRWIEVKFTLSTPEGDRTLVAKLLIPEKHLGRGKSPADNLIRGWVKVEQEEVQEIRDLKEERLSPFAVFLAGPPSNVKELDKIEVDSKLGKMPCAGLTAEQDFAREGITIKLKIENRLHEKAPFGIVTSRMNYSVERDGQTVDSGVFSLKLTDMGTTALSELGDKK